MNLLRTLRYALQRLPLTTKDIPDPKNRITLSALKKTKDGLAINYPGLIVTTFSNTESMNPVLDEGHHGLLSKKFSISDLQVGDIISFSRPLDGKKNILHRIVEIGRDAQGWFCITKGDNTLIDDGKIREEDITDVLVGILY